MRPVQRIIIAVNVKSGGFPTGVGMATCTIRRDDECDVIRIGTLVVIRQMATLAGVRRVVVVAVDMAGIAIIGDRRMGAGQRIKTVVIKCRRHPRCLTVTSGAVCGKLSRFVVGIGRLIVVGDMAARAGVRRVVVVAVVTGRTII